MESQLQRTRGHTYDDTQNPGLTHSAVEDEGEHHQEKKSVIKKVKDKAKKIKHTLQKHGLGHEHEHDHDYRPDHTAEDEEDDDEVMEDPEVHGAPIYDSAAVTSAAAPSHGVNLEKPTAIGEDRRGAGLPGTDIGDGRGHGMGVQGEQPYLGKSGLDTGHATEDKDFSFPSEIHGTRITNPDITDRKDASTDQPVARIGILEALDEDPNYVQSGTKVHSNYETKVTDPTGQGGGEADMAPLIQSVGKMTISDESGTKRESKWEQSDYTGSHDQFAPGPIPTADEFAPKHSTATPTQGVDESTPKSYDPSKPEELPRDTLTGKSPSEQSGYAGKISAATSAIADKAISAKNAVAAKLGYGGTTGTGGEGVVVGKETTGKSAATVTEKLAPVYGKVAEAGSAVISKVKGTSTSTGEGDEGKVVGDKGVSMTEYWAEKLKPGEEDKALSEVISESLHMKRKETGERKVPPLEKVTESEEVERRLGTEKPREEEDAIAAGSESRGNGKGVVDRIKDAVGLWASKGNNNNNNQEKCSQGSSDSAGGNASSIVAGEVEYS